jgi:glc operon protein GlcG
MKLLPIIAALTAAQVAHAQTVDKKTLSLEGARRAVAAVVAEAHAKGVGAAVAVVDDGGNLMALERVDGTFAAGARISAGKARTAALFKKPTAFFEDVVNKGRTAMAALDDFTPLQGGIPILVDGQIVGAVGVSGASSARQDEELAAIGAAAVAGARADVVYIEGAKVAAAFVKGMPLVETGDYKVHASHRDAAGQVEVHATDTDIIYTLEGTATFVTGGTMIDGKPTAEGEIRGARIEGGETRKLAKGDVVIVPHGVPHWFKQVSAPFNYYVVKVH